MSDCTCLWKHIWLKVCRVGSRLVELVVGHPRPSQSGTGVPWVSLPGPTVCHRVQGDSVAKRQPFLLRLLVLLESWRRVVFAFAFHAQCATENTCTPARLEALFKLSVVIILSHLNQLSAGCGCFLQWNSFPTNLDWHVLHLVIFFEISSHFSCLLRAVSPSILFTRMQICFFLGRSINFGLSFPSLGHTAIFATGDTLYSVSAVLRASSIVVRVASFKRNWSIPTRAAVFLHETSMICSVVRLIINTVRWMLLTLRSPLRWAAMMLFVLRLSISFSKNARFLTISFSMIEIACWSVSMTSTSLASDLLKSFASSLGCTFWDVKSNLFSTGSLLIPSEACLLISPNLTFTLLNDSLLVTS